MPIDASEAKAYIQRWEAFAELEKQGPKPVSVAENWRQLNAIKRRAARLGITREDDEGEMLQTQMTAVEMTGTIDEHNQLHLDDKLPIIGPKRVRVIVLTTAEEEISEEEWLKAAARNPAFQFLHDAAEEIYTLEDGKPIEVEK